MKLARCVYPFILLLVLLNSCSGRPRAIPEKKFVKIYAEMMMADKWIAAHPECREEADTCLFYEAVWNKYGYTREDFLYSISQRVKDTEAFSKTMEAVSEYLLDRASDLSGDSEEDRNNKKLKVENEPVIISIDE